jgi:hypothetical protein
VLSWDEGKQPEAAAETVSQWDTELESLLLEIGAPMLDAGVAAPEAAEETGGVGSRPAGAGDAEGPAEIRGETDGALRRVERSGIERPGAVLRSPECMGARGPRGQRRSAWRGAPAAC